MGAAESTPKVSSVEATEDVPEYNPPDNDYQLVFEAIKELEFILLADFDSSGDNLHQMISSTDEKLPMDLIVDMRALAVIRNNMAHEYSCDALPDRQDFIDKYKSCVKRLKEEVKRRNTEEEIFYNEVVQKHRKLHPRPAIAEPEPEPELQTEEIKTSSCIACFWSINELADNR